MPYDLGSDYAMRLPKGAAVVTDPTTGRPVLEGVHVGSPCTGGRSIDISTVLEKRLEELTDEEIKVWARLTYAVSALEEPDFEMDVHLHKSLQPGSLKRSVMGGGVKKLCQFTVVDAASGKVNVRWLPS